jgi:hypothetical protein
MKHWSEEGIAAKHKLEPWDGTPYPDSTIYSDGRHRRKESSIADWLRWFAGMLFVLGLVFLAGSMIGWIQGGRP